MMLLHALNALCKRIILLAALIIGLWGGGLLWFTSQIPASASADSTQTDAIVVLTGSNGRIAHGLLRFSQDKAKALLISGAVQGNTVNQLLLSAPAALRARISPDAAGRITIGYHAHNTIGNALETRDWMQEHHYKSLRVVTANYHMPRSMLELRYALPDTTLIPDATVTNEFVRERWWKDKESRAMVFSEYHKYLLVFIRHFLLFWTEHI